MRALLLAAGARAISPGAAPGVAGNVFKDYDALRGLDEHTSVETTLDFEYASASCPNFSAGRGFLEFGLA